ncbi:hypothetical protein BDW74DRAFT_172644 [Aspergillus multicolor]|uniref:uncharacterized protein n=1 Tax=Aspergillus multicolor TaxID=41759 RepID=UPI003CCCCBB5
MSASGCFEPASPAVRKLSISPRTISMEHIDASAKIPRAKKLPFTALLLLAIQNLSSVTLQHGVHSSSAGTARFNPLAGILLVESAKLTISSALFYICHGYPPVRDSRKPTDIPASRRLGYLTITRDTALPALLYTLATILQSMGAYYLDLIPYLALSQLKVILAPLFASLILKQRYSVKGWLCVLSMTAGIILCQISTASNPNVPSSKIPAV